MIDLSIRRPVATAALYVALLALGAYSFRLIPVELLPDVEYPRLTLSARWSGASPEAMEAQVTSPLEAAARQVADVRKIESTSRADPRGTGSEAQIDVEFARGARMEFARLALSERVAALKDELPPGVRPEVQPYTPPEFSREKTTFLSYRLSGPYTFSHLAEIARERIRPVLLGLDGVSAVNVFGAEEREISVELDRGRLEAFGLRPEDVRARIGELAVLRAPGSLSLQGRVVALAVRTRVRDAAELERLVIEESPEGPVRLGDLGRVRLQTAEAESYFRIDGQPAIVLTVEREAGTNAIRLADAVKTEASGLTGVLPPGGRLELDYDQSKEIRSQLQDLRLRALAAAIAIFLVLMIFLRSLGAVLVVFATIGFSVLIAVNGLYLGGFSLNILTLAGLAWGFGLVVDNGIVVLENVARHRRRGKPPLIAARDGARQVMLPVLAATATTAIVLVPFLFLQGELRLYYLPLAYAVGFSIVASLFVAFTFVPSMAARLAPVGAGSVGVVGEPEQPGAADGSAVGSGREEVEDPEGAKGPARAGSTAPAAPFYLQAYRMVLGFGLDHPALVAAVCLACLGGSAYLFDQHVNRGVLWSSFWGNRTYIDVNLSFPRGAGLARVDSLARSFEAKIATLPEVKRFETRVSPRWGNIRITFPKDLEKTQVPVAIKEQMVAYSHGFSGADVRVYGYGPSFYGGGGSPPNYSVKVLGYNYLEVRNIADALAGRLKRFSRIRDVDPNASGRFFERDRAFEYTLAVDRAALGSHDLTVEDLLNYVGANVQSGIPGQRLRIAGEDIPYAVKLRGFREFDLGALRGLRVPTPDGGDVRLADVAHVERRQVLSRILREDQQYQRRVAWEFRGPRKLGDLVRDAVLEATDLAPGYKIEEEEGWRWKTEEKAQVYLALGFSVLLIYMVTAALFESLAAPFVVLLTLPLALIGVFLIFFYTNASFTRTAYIGTIMMGGIVVNNAILIVYHIGELRERLATREAILRATLERVRPILMTTFTTVFGLLPLVLFSASQNENIWNALALATIGGLLSSTLFVLIAIPVAYKVFVARGS